MITLVMPQMGESLAEGTLVRWLKKPGDRVERDEPLFEISTDKVDTDVPSSTAGVLKEILVAEGQTVAVGSPVAVIEPAEPTAAAAQPVSVTSAPAALPAPSAEAAKEEPAGHFKSAHAPQLVAGVDQLLLVLGQRDLLGVGVLLEGGQRGLHGGDACLHLAPTLLERGHLRLQPANLVAQGGDLALLAQGARAGPLACIRAQLHRPL